RATPAASPPIPAPATNARVPFIASAGPARRGRCNAVQRYYAVNSGSSGVRLHSQHPADRSQAIAHVGEAGAVRLPVSFEAGAIIEDFEEQAAGILPDPHLRGCSVAGVLSGVLESFQAAEVDGRLDLGRVPAHAVRGEAGWK